jgi:UDP-N-acetylmuramoyl-L-alanyl-D-glutamate--2,6-diaminopimelate ligase
MSIKIGHDVEITGLTCDSRVVKEGFLFAAFKGNNVEGSKYISDAIKAGASVILTDEIISTNGGVIHIAVDNPRWVFAKMAANFYNDVPENIVAITGTNGKTSIAHFYYQLCNMQQKNSAALGTMGLVSSNNEDVRARVQNNLTTPDAVALMSQLEKLKKDYQVDYAALEASSHGLSQYRIDGVNLKAAAFTNISRDHMDYHNSFDNYFDAKMRLFEEVLPKNALAILNADIPQYEEMYTRCTDSDLEVISVGYKGKGITIKDVITYPSNQAVKFEYGDILYTVQLPLIGEFQIYNALMALALVVSSGVDKEKTVAYLSQLKPAPGRMEKIGNHKKGAGIYIDYAHTPDALEKALIALRKHTENNLVVLFGCGGDRDKGKRKIMGEIAKQHANMIIVTDDNPRTELPEEIRKEILLGCEDAKEIADRKQAIAHAVQSLGKGDVLLIAGKGHENYQIIGTEKLPFDDSLVVLEAM